MIGLKALSFWWGSLLAATNMARFGADLGLLYTRIESTTPQQRLNTGAPDTPSMPLQTSLGKDRCRFVATRRRTATTRTRTKGARGGFGRRTRPSRHSCQWPHGAAPVTSAPICHHCCRHRLSQLADKMPSTCCCHSRQDLEGWTTYILPFTGPPCTPSNCPKLGITPVRCWFLIATAARTSATPPRCSTDSHCPQRQELNKTSCSEVHGA